MTLPWKPAVLLMNHIKRYALYSSQLQRRSYYCLTCAKKDIQCILAYSSFYSNLTPSQCVQPKETISLIRRDNHGTRSQQKPDASQIPSEMSCWQIYSYGGPDQLRLNHGVKTPFLTGPKDVLVEVHAASVNPIDTRSLDGYGSVSINTARKFQGKLRGGTSEFPLTLGRDFSGVVVQTGRLVPPSHCVVGDEVWGTLQFTSPGSHAQYTIANANGICRKPRGLSHIEAVALPYAAASTWTALTCPPNGLTASNTVGKRILILGASGGVGTFAIQLMKAWGGHVTAVCGTSSLERVLSLGADVTLDYTSHDVRLELSNIERFDVVFDLVGGKKYDYAIDFLREYQGAVYASMVHPVLMNNDKLGLPFGLAATALSYGQKLTQTLRKGRVVKWGIHQPSRPCMLAVTDLVNAGKITPVIEEVYSFTDLPAAYERVAPRHNKGKIIVDMKSN